MDVDAPELAPERAASAELSSTRLNPFPEDENPSARKRQRIEGCGSRSASLETSQPAAATADPFTHVNSSSPSPSSNSPLAHNRTAYTSVTHAHLPRTPSPPRTDVTGAESIANKVTLNLRTPTASHSHTPRALNPDPSSPTSPLSALRIPSSSPSPPPAPTSLDSESDLAEGSVQITPRSSSSQSVVASPAVELVQIMEDEEASPPVAIIDGSGDYDYVEQDVLSQLPYHDQMETGEHTIAKLAKYFEYDSMESDEVFCRFRDWIYDYLQVTSRNRSQWYDSWCDNQDLWNAIPDLIWALAQRRIFFGTFLKHERRASKSLSEFLVLFTRLTARFAIVDSERFSQHGPDTSEEPLLASRPYLAALSYLVRTDEGNHLAQNLEKHYSWDWEHESLLLLRTFVTEGANITTLTTIARVLLAGKQTTKQIDALVEITRIAAKISFNVADSLNDAGSRSEYEAHVQATLKQGFEFYTTMAAGLAPIFEKHLTIMTLDSAGQLIPNLGQLLCLALKNDVSTAMHLRDDLAIRNPEISSQDGPVVIANEWKFNMVEKLITCGQMQLRVLGASMMCNELLEIYRESRPDPCDHPVSLHFARIVREHRLIDYIVGIGSHPEIITESANIVGFLVATKTYGREHTDTIWHTVTTSQNPRVVEAILRMLLNIAHLFDYEALLYLFVKASQLPLESFTTHLRNLCDKLVHFTIQKVNENRLQTDSPPYELITRLLRDSVAPRMENAKLFQEIYAFANTQLRELLQITPGTEIRNSIYLSCIRDIAAKETSSPGSICVLALVLRWSTDSDLHFLCTNHNLTRIIIDELEFSQEHGNNAPINAALSGAVNNSRREILSQIILRQASTITSELGEKLWILIVSMNNDPRPESQIAWQMLLTVAKKTGFRNSFLIKCFEEYLPLMDPHLYSLGCLEFAREGVLAWLQQNSQTLRHKHHPLSAPGIEQLWKLAMSAPLKSMEMPSIAVLVEVYLEWPITIGLDPIKIQQTRLELINRCLSQLSSAAAKIRASSQAFDTDSDEMSVSFSSDMVSEQERLFLRSLCLLKEFLRIYQLRPGLASTPLSPIVSSICPIEGEPMEIKYQAFDNGNATTMQTLSIGKENTVQALFDTLQQATGFKSYKIYHSGRMIDPDEIDLCTSLADMNIGHGLVLVHRRDSKPASLPSQPQSSALDREILGHLEELWSYLSMDEHLAKEIYFFLIRFPSYEKLLQFLHSPDTPYHEIFPQGQPFKCLYAVHTLKEDISTKLQKAALTQSMLRRAISLLIGAMSDPDLFGSFTKVDLRHYIVLHFMDSLIHLLRDPVPVEGLAEVFGDELVNRLLQLLIEAYNAPATQHSAQLVARCFEAILEVSMHSPALWAVFVTHPATPKLLHDLLLAEPRPGLRKLVMKQITSKCTFSPSLAMVSAAEFSRDFWSLISPLISGCVDYPHRCNEVFTLAQFLFRSIAEVTPETLSFEECLLQWGQLLLSHDSIENAVRPQEVDNVAQGLTGLLFWCASYAKACAKPLSSINLALKLFAKHLFPDLSVPDSHGSVHGHTPLLNAGTRKLICDTILLLSKDDRTATELLLNRVQELVPYDDMDENDPYAYDLPFLFDRSRSIRAPSGYVGLKNLSNTCYLNSLMTQLFMNLSFRRFMLNVADTEHVAHQKLLVETQKLFAYMQNSLKRFVDPSNVAGSVRTYEETNIDVTIQMDVDEFFNLIFDRWEGQMPTAAAKSAFRSIYGGQLVQQIKSKECPHISERLEPFSTIQCDIKGKTSLQESLQAYVDGDIMEGDNKYKCSTCDKHVDAVKRACLKDVPDNLIFHLKRFDFNLRTLQRSKINDYFAFPHRLDMRPYKVDYLMDESGSCPEDIFELTGILVHSGTAESGHYYSYIRETPVAGQTPTWVEFNDDNVTPFDPNTIESNCFGGSDYRNGSVDSGGFSFDKGWSAYMLFYQRSSTVTVEQQILEDSGGQHPIKLPVQIDLANHIESENELILRKHCLYDESHPTFVLRLLENLRQLENNQCSSSHNLETVALASVLGHLDQVVSRTKDVPHLKDFTYQLKLCINSCAECAGIILDWFIQHPEAFRSLVMRCLEPEVRIETCTIIVLALKKLKTFLPQDYGPEISPDDSDDMFAVGDGPQYFRSIVKLISRYWEVFHLSTRAWPEYFGLLDTLASSGPHEAAVIIDSGFLQRVLEVITADTALQPATQYLRMLTILAKKPVAKPVSYEKVIQLLDTLLAACDLNQEPVPNKTPRFRLVSEEQWWLPVNQAELDLLTKFWTRSRSHILTEKLLQLNQNNAATQSIIKTLLDCENRTFSDTIWATLQVLAHRNLTGVSASSYLRAAITFCSSQVQDRIIELIKSVTLLARSMDATEGRDFLIYYKALFRVALNRSEEYSNDSESDMLWDFIALETVKIAPSLLMHPEQSIREGIEEHLQATILNHDEPWTEEQIRSLIHASRVLGVQCLRYLDNEYVRKRVRVTRATLESILRVIDDCRGFFNDDSNDRPDEEFFHLFSVVMSDLRRLTVDEIEEEASEWEASEDALSSSEAMDTVAELGGLGMGEMEPEI